MKKVLLVLSFGVLSVALLAVSGCGPFWVDPYITVKESPLNWMDIHYYDMRRKPIHRVTVSIRGTGLVEVRRGSSELVSNDFAKGYASASWGDIRTHRIQISPHDVNNIFQTLVNFGVLDREKTGRGSDEKEFPRFIAVQANLCNYTYSDNVNIFEVDPDLAEQLLDVVREFENPSH